METILKKVLKKQFSLFIKNFKEDQLNISFAKSEGSLNDLVLNEQVIQELLLVPPTLQVEKSYCDLLTLKLPSVTNLGKEPIVLTLHKVDVDLREPEKVGPAPTLLKDSMKKKKPTKSEILDNMMIVVNNLHMTIQTKDGPLVMIDLDDIQIRSTNGQWQVVEFSKMKSIDKEQGTESLYKLITVKSITAVMLTQKGAHVILDHMPIKIQITSKRRSKDWALVSSEIEFVLQQVHFKYSHEEWLLLIDMVKKFQLALTRPIPPPVVASTDPVVARPDISITGKLENWTFTIVETQDDKSPGFTFGGQNFLVVFNASKTQAIRLGGEKDTTTTEVEETVITVLLSTLNVLQLQVTGSDDANLVTQKNFLENSAGHHILMANLVLRRPTADAIRASSAQYAPLIGVDLSLSLGNIQVVGNRASWKKLIRFFATKSPEEEEAQAQLQQEAAPAAELTLEAGLEKAKSAKEGLQKLRDQLKLTDDWSHQIKLNLKATDLRVILPSDSTSEFKDNTLCLDLGSFSMANHADWKITPHLGKGMTYLSAPNPAPPLAPPRSVGQPYKLSFAMEGVACQIQKRVGSTVESSSILEPASIKLYSHIYKRENKTKDGGVASVTQFEVVFHTGEFNLHVNHSQIHYLQYMRKRYFDPRKISNLTKSRVAKAKELAQSKLKDKLVELKDSVQDKDYVTPIKDKVVSTLEAYKWIVYIHLENGVLKAPIQDLLAPVEPSTDQPAAPKEDAEVKFDKLDLGFENNANGQTVVLHLGSFHAHGLDTPKMSSIIVLTPLQAQAEDEKLPEAVEPADSLVFRYKRRRKPVAGTTEVTSETDVFGQLQKMQVKVSKKPNFVSTSPSLGVADIQAMVTRIIAKIQERKSDIEVLKSNVKQIDIADVRWAFEAGNCEFLIEEAGSNGSAARPIGAVRLSDTNRVPLIKLARDLENKLVQAKEQINHSTVQHEDDVAKLAELESTLLRLAAEKDTKIANMYEEYQALEMKMVKAKMDAAELQMQNDNLASELRKYKK